MQPLAPKGAVIALCLLNSMNHWEKLKRQGLEGFNLQTGQLGVWLLFSWTKHHSLLAGIDDVNKLRLQGSATHKESINVRLFGQLLAVRSSD